MNRIWNVVRMHLVNRWSHFGLPWVILGTAFAISVAVWLIIIATTGPEAESDMSGTRFSGAVSSIFIYQMVVAIQAVNLSFPFALGFSATRREFYLGTALTFTITAAGNAVLLTLLAVIEDATGGWGLGGHMFTAVWVDDGNVLARWFSFFALQMLFVAMGAVAATIYMRWRTNGMVVFWVALAIVGVGLFALAGYTGSWDEVGAWFVAMGPTGVLAWSLVPTVLFGLAGWLVLRKTTTRA